MEIERKTAIEAPASQVWEVLGDHFANIGRWFSGAHASEALGAHTAGGNVSGRVCKTSGGELIETITAYDAERRSFAFRITDGLPGFVREASNVFTVVETSATTSEVTYHVDIELQPLANAVLGWVFRRKVAETGSQLLEDLRCYVETGEVSERKRRSQQRHQRAA
jgi:carbon monoxide dehydrogenase subunit G